MRNFWNKYSEKIKKKHIVCNKCFVFENRAVCEITWEDTVRSYGELL